MSRNLDVIVHLTVADESDDMTIADIVENALFAVPDTDDGPGLPGVEEIVGTDWTRDE